MLIIPVFSFELTQNTRPQYINVTDRQGDRRTDDLRTTYDSTTAHSASSGKNLGNTENMHVNMHVDLVYY